MPSRMPGTCQMSSKWLLLPKGWKPSWTGGAVCPQQTGGRQALQGTARANTRGWAACTCLEGCAKVRNDRRGQREKGRPQVKTPVCHSERSRPDNMAAEPSWDCKGAVTGLPRAQVYQLCQPKLLSILGFLPCSVKEDAKQNYLMSISD